MAELRHALAHANGRLELLREDSRQRLVAWAEDEKSIDLHSDLIVLTPRYAENAFRFLEGLLRELIQRTRRSF
jgi:hypothetical protein